MSDTKTMLVADADEMSRRALVQIFQEKFLILEADNGRTVLDYLNSQPIHIVLLDMNLPIISTGELLTKFSASLLFKDIAVIVTGSSESEAIAVMADVTRAADFLQKPYHPAIARHRILNVLANQENEMCKLRQSAQDEKINKMQHIIDIDQLTGLLTQNAFLQQAGERLSREQKTTYYIVYLDIASFKLINELFTMNTGDTILCTAASYFSTIVGRRGLASHLAADAFALLLPEDLLDMDLLIQGIDAIMHSLGIYRTVSFFAGVYPVENAYISASQMLDRAHMAMSAARAAQGKRYAFYDSSLRSKMADDQLIAREMEASLLQGQFFAKFQPIYQLTTDANNARPIAAEALLRWEHPQYGFISPKRFIPVFERNGFINRVDRFTWEQACHFLSRQKDWGMEITPVSINISYITFCDASFVEYLMRLLRKYDLQPWMLWLEISEKSYVQSPAQLLRILRRLKSCGFSVIVDDFGSSFSPLGVILDLPIDMLKIDLRRLYAHDKKERLDVALSGVINMVKQLGIEVVAEGVESEQQAAMLHGMQCSNIQGFYYSRPMTSDAYIELLSHKSRCHFSYAST